MQLLTNFHTFICILKSSIGPDIALQLLQPPVLEVLIHLLVHVLNRIQMKMTMVTMKMLKKEEDNDVI